MAASTAEILLSEFREFRRDFNEFKTESAERIAILESQMRDLFGNGQPGRVSKLESKTDKHSRIIWVALGAWTVINALLAYAFRVHI